MHGTSSKSMTVRLAGYLPVNLSMPSWETTTVCTSHRGPREDGLRLFQGLHLLRPLGLPLFEVVHREVACLVERALHLAELQDVRARGALVALVLDLLLHLGGLDL